jgi:hypothetical protein
MPPSGGTTKDENLIPPLKGVQGDVLWRTWHWKAEGHPPTPPLIGGIFTGVIHAGLAGATEHEN